MVVKILANKSPPNAIWINHQNNKITLRRPRIDPWHSFQWHNYNRLIACLSRVPPQEANQLTGELQAYRDDEPPLPILYQYSTTTTLCPSSVRCACPRRWRGDDVVKTVWTTNRSWIKHTKLQTLLISSHSLVVGRLLQFGRQGKCERLDPKCESLSFLHLSCCHFA